MRFLKSSCPVAGFSAVIQVVAFSPLGHLPLPHAYRSYCLFPWPLKPMTSPWGDNSPFSAWIIYKNTRSIRAFVHYWNSVLHGSILCKYLLNEWMSKRIELLVRLSLERKTLCCPQNVFAPWLGHLHSELPSDGISTGWGCQFPNSGQTMGHRSLLLLIAGLRTIKMKKLAVQTLHNAGEPFFPPPLLPSQAPKVLTSVRQRGSDSLSRCSLQSISVKHLNCGFSALTWN